MPTETITVHQRGALPGIAGILSPGIYEVDYDARTATPVVEQSEQQQEQAPNDAGHVETPPDDQPPTDTQSES
jgi:hypothetical protein